MRLLGVIVILFLFSFFSVSAISMSGSSLQFHTVYPGYHKEFGFSVGGAENIRTSLQGPENITKYATLVDDDPDGPPRGVKIIIDIPDSIPPGRHSIVLRALDVTGIDVAAVGARAAMLGRVNLLSLYPGKYIEWKAQARPVNTNEKTNFTFAVTNLGTESVDKIQGYFEVYDPDGNFVSNISSESATIASDSDVNIIAVFDATGLDKGVYSYEAYLTWDGNLEGPKRGEFRVGTLELIISDYTDEFIIEAINIFEITVESEWNGVIEDAYAEIQTPTGDLKTPNVDVSKFGKETLETFWDTTGLGEGTFPGRITLRYEGGKTEKNITLYVNKTGKGYEPPKKENFFTNLSTTTLLLIIIILILVANVFYFVVRGMRKK